MDSKCRGILLMGFGAHARRLYWPICRKDADAMGFPLAGIVDLENQRESVEMFLREYSLPLPVTLFLPNDDAEALVIPRSSEERLNALVEQLGIGFVIIATDPLNHLLYAKWALQRGISVLLDKPITTRRGIAHSLQKSDGIVRDFLELLRVYRNERRRFPLLSCEVMVQRRHHPLFAKAQELLAEVSSETGCPVTSVQSYHGDGQWRLPAEVVQGRYHPFNSGYGKCSHSGYHFFDAVVFFLESTERIDKQLDQVNVFSAFCFPADFFAQIVDEDYRRVFPSYIEPDEAALITASCCGEIDAFITCEFKSGERTMSLASINLLHNSVSQRGWLDATGRDPYKGNGRVRHESHYVTQGPFQALSLVSYQSCEMDSSSSQIVYETGGEYHFDMHVFRNQGINRNWRPYEKVSIAEISSPVMCGRARGHQEDAKRQSVLHFLRRASGGQRATVSDLESHHRTVQLMSSVYRSNALRLSGANPVATASFRKMGGNREGN